MFWLFISVTITVCVAIDWIGYGLGSSRIDRLPYSGWLLEVAGVMTVAYGFAKKIDLYGGASIGSRIGSWFRACPIFRQDTSVIVGLAELKLSPAHVTATGTVGLPPDADLDARVVRLEGMVDELHEALRNLRETVKDDIRTVREDLNQKLISINQELASVKAITS